MEAFRAKGYEVLLLVHPVDELWVDSVPDFDGKKLKSIAKGQVDLDTEDEKKDTESAREQQQKDFAGLLSWLGTTLADDVKEVRLSSRLTTSPACIVDDEHAMSPSLEKMYRAMGQNAPHIKRILEVNPEHPLVSGLRKAQDERPEDAGLADVAELLYGTALLAEGGDLIDPARFSRLLARHLTNIL
jgi:molecular chaperone HtpG